MRSPATRWSDLAIAAAPAGFVVLWSSGFIVARLVAPHSDPLTFLSARYVLAVAVLAALAVAFRAPWPRSPREWLNNVVAGLLLHGVYLGGIFWGVKHGLPAGIAGLLSGLQPVITAGLAGPLLGERVGPRRWSGIAIGFAGAAMVLAPRIGSATDAIPAPALLAGFAAIAGITAGTLWQKRVGGAMDMRTGNAVQFAAALVPTVLLAVLTEDLRLDPVPEMVAGLLWSVFGLSVGAIPLFLFLIRRGAVAQVASLLYLVPPVTALMAWLAFGEVLSAVQIGGMLVAAIGVALASRPEPPRGPDVDADSHTER
jgi:drug/metabolite transporter (DMT)-like permease